MLVELNPIYRLLPPDFRLPVLQPEITPTDEELAFWDNQPPEEIMLASGSVRKAVMLLYHLHQIKYQLVEFNNETGDRIVTNVNPTPQDFYDHLCAHTTNGNGELKEKTFVGYFHGVPMYVDPQDGETKNNHPGVQAANKVMSMVQLEKYQGRDIIFIATDTVDGPTTHELRFHHLASQHPVCPKVEADISMAPDFPQASWPKGAISQLHAQRMMFMLAYHSLRSAMVGNERAEGGLLLGKPSGLDYFPTAGPPEQQAVFLYWFKELLLTPVKIDAETAQLVVHDDQVVMLHTNGIAMVRTMAQNAEHVQAEPRITTTDIRLTVADRRHVVPRSQSGGGGIIQQAGVPFDSLELLRQIFPEKDIAHQVLAQLTPEQLVELPHIVFNQITGMPSWIITHLLSTIKW